jgi:hypothetical protein
VDDRSARGTLADGSIHVSLLFTFNTEGLIDSVRAERRGRTVNGKIIHSMGRALLELQAA